MDMNMTRSLWSVLAAVLLGAVPDAAPLAPEPRGLRLDPQYRPGDDAVRYSWCVVGAVLAAASAAGCAASSWRTTVSDRDRGTASRLLRRGPAETGVAESHVGQDPRACRRTPSRAEARIRSDDRSTDRSWPRRSARSRTAPPRRTIARWRTSISRLGVTDEAFEPFTGGAGARSADAAAYEGLREDLARLGLSRTSALADAHRAVYSPRNRRRPGTRWARCFRRSARHGRARAAYRARAYGSIRARPTR